jgi:hypothetical protein
MRQLKFRICYTDRQDNKSIIYDAKNFHIGLDGNILENYGDPNGKHSWEVPFDVWTPPFIQQWTGLQDKNGKDIYEGDLVTVYDKKIYEVKWGKAYNGFQYNLYDKDDDLDDYYGGIGDNRCLKVIGNIFENPRYFNETT